MRTNQSDNDVPLGIVGRLVGLRIVPPGLQAGEEIRWSTRGNRWQTRLRAVGGRLYLTNRRLIFGRNRLESLLGGREWSLPLSELVSVEMTGRRAIGVELASGGVERFLVADRDHAVSLIAAAIR